MLHCRAGWARFYSSLRSTEITERSSPTAAGSEESRAILPDLNKILGIQGRLLYVGILNKVGISYAFLCKISAEFEIHGRSLELRVPIIGLRH